MDRHWTERLSEYLDGELNATERAVCAAHLETCEACARLLAELEAVKAEAAALPAIAAPADLWDAIEARLEPVMAAPVARPRRRHDARPWGSLVWTGPALATAAAALVVVTAAGTWTAARFGLLPGIARREPVTATAPLAANGAAPAPAATPGIASRSQFPAGGVSARTVDFGERQYDVAIADLERVLSEHRSELDTTTVRVVEKNLALIDAAIADARRALAADPASPYLNGYLASTMKRKVELLRQVTAALRS